MPAFGAVLVAHPFRSFNRSMRKSFAIPFASLLLTLLLAGCGGDDTEAATVAPAVDTSQAVYDPLAEIPREELYGASAAANVWSPHFELEVPDLPRGWDGARIAILSDLHLGMWDEDEEVARAAVELANRLRPDVIVLLGDYARSTGDARSLRDVLGPLQGRPVVAVLGDRDVRSDSLANAVTGALRSSGVTVLRDTSTVLQRNGDELWIAGLDPRAARMGSADQSRTLAQMAANGPTPLLLVHNAAFAARAPNRTYPIVLAGNTFCGDVDVEGEMRLEQIATDLFPGGEIANTERLFRVQGQTVLITCGMGYGFVPVRFGAPPEVPILTIRRFSTGAPEESQEAGDSTLVAPADSAAAPQ